MPANEFQSQMNHVFARQNTFVDMPLMHLSCDEPPPGDEIAYYDGFDYYCEESEVLLPQPKQIVRKGSINDIDDEESDLIETGSLQSPLMR